MSIKSIIVVTGPLAAGKTTYSNIVARELNIPYVGEIQFGVDTTDPEWSDLIIAFAENHHTRLVETHLNHGQYDAGDQDFVIGKIEPPSNRLEFHLILPTPHELFNRYKQRDRYYSIKEAQRDIEYYQQIVKQLSKVTIISS